MYSYIKGIVTKKTDDNKIVLENNQIGYEISTSLNTISNLPTEKKQVQIFTHLYVREDIYALYGFLTTDELKMFHLLISVSGIGPKAAIAVMSTMTPSKFTLAVVTGDISTLTKAQGIGKKTAERVILELKDKVKKETEKLNLNSDIEIFNNDTPDNNLAQEALEAMLVLGYSKDEALKSIKQNLKEDIDIETLIKKSLKSLSRL